MGCTDSIMRAEGGNVVGLYLTSWVVLCSLVVMDVSLPLQNNQEHGKKTEFSPLAFSPMHAAVRVLASLRAAAVS